MGNRLQQVLQMHYVTMFTTYGSEQSQVSMQAWQSSAMETHIEFQMDSSIHSPLRFQEEENGKLLKDSRSLSFQEID